LTGAARPYFTATMLVRIPTFCGKDCGGDACPLLAVVEDGRVTGMERNPAAGPALNPCPRGYSLHKEHYAKDRILSPLLADGPRGSGRFKEIGWDEALSLVARRLGEIRSRYGPTSVLNLASAGSTGVFHDSQNLITRFLNAAGGATMLAGNYSSGAANFVLPYLFGSAYKRSGWDAATARYSRLIVLWGANILEARLGSGLASALAEARRAGTPIIVLDPRYSRTAKTLGAEWIPIRPGTDAAMMLAVLHILFRDGLIDRSRAAELATGFADLEALVNGTADGVGKSAAWAEARCGVPARVIESFARCYAASKPAMLIPGYSIQRVLNGEQTFRLTVALQIATGNFGVSGGSSGSINNRLPRPRVGSIPDLATAASPSVPVLRWPDVILHGRSGNYPDDIAAAYVVGFNAVNQGADSLKSVEAMRRLDFSVCHELFMTPTARLCDLVLPVASPLEKEDIGLPWLGNYLLYKRQVVPLRGMARTDYDILSELSERMGFGSIFTGGKSAAAWIASLLDDSEIPDQEAFKSTGIYMAADQERTGLSDFAADPQGHPLPTPSGKVELRSEAYARATGRAAVPEWVDIPYDPHHPFLLITPKTIHRTHSQNGGPDKWELSPDAEAGSQTNRGQDVTSPATMRADHGQLNLCDADASVLGLVEGDKVIIYNDRGSLAATAVIIDGIMRGVVCLHQGVWLNLGPGNIDTAGSANVLSSTDGSGPALAPVMHGIPVGIKKALPSS